MQNGVNGHFRLNQTIVQDLEAEHAKKLINSVMERREKKNPAQMSLSQDVCIIFFQIVHWLSNNISNIINVLHY